MTLTPPARLEAGHDVTSFDCGQPVLDSWLQRRGFGNETSGASRTYVVCAGNRVVGYYALAAGSVANAASPGGIRRNMPDPIPVLLLGRLAVDRAWQGKGIARGLLRDAALRTHRAADIVGIRALLVQAIDDGAAEFYARHGFRPAPIDPHLLFMPLSQVRASLPPPKPDS